MYFVYNEKNGRNKSPTFNDDTVLIPDPFSEVQVADIVEINFMRFDLLILFRSIF